MEVAFVVETSFDEARDDEGKIDVGDIKRSILSVAILKRTYEVTYQVFRLILRHSRPDSPLACSYCCVTEFFPNLNTQRPRMDSQKGIVV